jgi:hypothetical protein
MQACMYGAKNNAEGGAMLHLPAYHPISPLLKKHRSNSFLI